MFVKTISRFW